MKSVIFCDFDGTITLEDTGKKILSTFTQKDWRCYDKLVIDGVIGTRDALQKQYGLIERISFEELTSIVDSIPIDPSFQSFLDWIKENGIGFIIVSDGFKQYIEEIFSSHNISYEDLDIRANSMDIIDGKVVISYLTSPCEHGCANCKYTHVKHFKDRGYKVIYIGDGLSDILPARELADLIFARAGGDLAVKLASDERLVTYTNFDQIRKNIEERFVLS
ncbi:MAG: MtnX-like HAD-IB family phosphatase [Candidatus Heimdallarchaeaceae archaeon]